MKNWGLREESEIETYTNFKRTSKFPYSFPLNTSNSASSNKNQSIFHKSIIFRPHGKAAKVIKV